MGKYNFCKKALALALSGTLALVPGCSSQRTDKYTAENSLPYKDSIKSSFEDTYHVVNDNGKRILKYYTEYIRLFYDPETGMKRAYAYYNGENGLYVYAVPLGTLEMVYMPLDFLEHYWDSEHAEYIEEHSVKFSAEDLEDYIGKVELDDSYSWEEIYRFIDLYAEGVNVIEGIGTGTKKR